MIDVSPPPLPSNKPVKRTVNVVTFLTVLAFVSAGLSFPANWIGEKFGGDGPGKAMLSGLLTLPCLVGTVGFTIAALVVVLIFWKEATPLVRCIGMLPVVTFAALVLINTYGPPETDIVVTYQGSEETMLVDVTTHFGAVGNHELVRGKYDLISSGTGLRHARVAWKRTVDSKEQEKFFDLKSDIPTYGKDRVVLISIYDDKATCEVRLGRWPR